MRHEWLQLVSLALYLPAGVCFELLLLSRVFIALSDSNFKFLLVVVSGTGIVSAAALAGALLPPIPWVVVPAVFLAALSVGELRRMWVRRQCRASPPSRVEDRRLSLARPITTTDLATLYYEIVLPRWNGKPFRVTLMSDLHANEVLPAAYYAQVMERVGETRPDLLFLCGDFVTDVECTAMLPGILRPVAGRPTFGSLGNHDYWADGEEVARAVSGCGVKLLRNSSERVRLAGGELIVSGCEDPWGPTRWQPPAGATDVPMLVLSHTADNVFKLSRAGASAVFSGHYHAGQVKLPVLGPVIVPSVYGRLFDHGHFMVGGTHLFVSSGVGSAVPPVRVFCQPDFFVVDVRGGGDSP